MRSFCVWLGLLAGLGATLTTLPGRAAEKADPETIEKLIKQLSNGRFTEREKAQKQLEEIGLPALTALKKAADQGDPETKRRAGELTAKIEKQQQGTKILAPTKLKLTYKDTPLKEAIDDFGKKSGCKIALLDPENKLSQRKITLDLPEMTFWEAFDKFCDKAGLVEADQMDAIPVGQPGFPGGIQIQPGVIQIQPGVIQIRPNVAPIKKAIPAPLPAEKVVPAEKVAPAQKVGGLAVQVEEKPVEAKPAPAIKAIKAVQKPAIAPAPAQQPAVQPIRRRPFRPVPGVPGEQPAQITLKEGKPSTVPTDYVGAVRVRAMDNVQAFGPGSDKELTVGLKVSPEAKIRWQQMVNVRVDKAIDDQDQKLMQAAAPMNQNGPQIGGFNFGGGFPGAFPVQGHSNGMHQYVPIRFTKGEKPSKTLKELTGTITAQVLAEPEVHITADDITKAGGKTFKGKEGGSIKVNSYAENNDQVTIKLELDAPKDVTPLGQGGFNGWNRFNGGGIQILPAIPLPAPAPAPALPPGAFAQQIQIQQIQIGGGGIAIGGPVGFGSPMGLELLDDKGNVIATTGHSSQFNGVPGGAFMQEHVLQFKLQKDQKPAKLVFKGSKSVNVEIPFSLKDVKIP